jgi:hypothetical protein
LRLAFAGSQLLPALQWLFQRQQGANRNLREADGHRIEVLKAELVRWEGYSESRTARARFGDLIEAARFELVGGSREFPKIR